MSLTTLRKVYGVLPWLTASWIKVNSDIDGQILTGGSKIEGNNVHREFLHLLFSFVLNNFMRNTPLISLLCTKTYQLSLSFSSTSLQTFVRLRSNKNQKDLYSIWNLSLRFPWKRYPGKYLGRKWKLWKAFLEFQNLQGVLYQGKDRFVQSSNLFIISFVISYIECVRASRYLYYLTANENFRICPICSSVLYSQKFLFFCSYEFIMMEMF